MVTFSRPTVWQERECKASARDRPAICQQRLPSRAAPRGWRKINPEPIVTPIFLLGVNASGILISVE
jgi:hypothetical protein